MAGIVLIGLHTKLLPIIPTSHWQVHQLLVVQILKHMVIFFSFLLLGNILMLFIDSPTTNTVDPTVMEGAQGSPKTFLNLDTPKSHNSSKYTVIL